MTGLYDLLAVPFGYIIGFFYDISQNYIFSILVITIITRLILLPSTIKQQRSSASQMRLQAKVRRIQEMYKGNQQKINEETQALYQREGFNPIRLSADVDSVPGDDWSVFGDSYPPDQCSASGQRGGYRIDRCSTAGSRNFFPRTGYPGN